MEDEEVDEKYQTIGKYLSFISLGTTEACKIITSINAFLSTYWEVIKQGITNKNPFKEKDLNLDKIDLAISRSKKTKSQVFRTQGFIKTVVYILCELSIHVNVDQRDEMKKLTDMFIPLLAVKGFVTGGKEQLVNYTLKTVERLCTKMPSLLTVKRYYSICKLLSENLNLTTREHI